MLHKQAKKHHDSHALSKKSQNVLHSLHLEGIEPSSRALKNIHQHDAGLISDEEFLQNIISNIKNK